MRFQSIQIILLLCVTLLLSAAGQHLRQRRSLSVTRYSSVEISSSICPFSIRVAEYHREYELPDKDSGWVETNDCDHTWRVDDLISIGDVDYFQVWVKANGQEVYAGDFPFDSMSSDTLFLVESFND
mmetsp:Transcript_14263/g.16203  ORF Transcript_14263/g.16203 Transcript_14263/m.16203 type:complete len:127 (-) Transcript_14263:447-827(-)|eukprot:CAMPEP_0184046060 /NCGR_PEP_ID=MMETSP0956-20121227/1304_1 /TAXON_ID=627963 /ORGANISM="Aplanochytrium sp, Strain PBS07" /LENGTH=126 /DNA_ID=CAMNT_0026337517 /DNA_START=1 /DNA_END=381 /DNA_ORIENTATION=+